MPSRGTLAVVLPILLLTELCFGSEVPAKTDFLSLYTVREESIAKSQENFYAKVESVDFETRERSVHEVWRAGTSIRRDKSGETTVVTPTRGFKVLPSNSKAGKYVVSRLRLSSDGFEEEMSEIRLGSELLFASEAFFEMRLSSLFSDPDFTLLNISEDQLNGDRVFVVHGKFQATPQSVRDIRWTFSVKKPWTLLRRTFSNGELTRVWDYEYGNELGSVPFVSRLICFDQVNGTMKTRKYESKYFHSANLGLMRIWEGTRAALGNIWF